MKERALRRHQEFKAKKKSLKTYNSCIGDLPQDQKLDLGNNIKKLRKVCVASHFNEHSKTETKKTLQEKKHDISMREQLS